MYVYKIFNCNLRNFSFLFLFSFFCRIINLQIRSGSSQTGKICYLTIFLDEHINSELFLFISSCGRYQFVSCTGLWLNRSIISINMNDEGVWIRISSTVIKLPICAWRQAVYVWQFYPPWNLWIHALATKQNSLVFFW